MRRTEVPDTPDAKQPGSATMPASGAPPARGRRTMGQCAHCRQPVEFHQEHVRLYRLFWHVECALAAHEPATD